MSAEVASLLLLLGLTIGFAATVFGALRALWPVAPGRITSAYSALMTIHATINLIDINYGRSSPDTDVILVANSSALLFEAVYGLALWRNSQPALHAAMALALGSYAALLMLIAAGQFPFSVRVFAISSLVAAATIAVAWVARARKAGDLRQPRKRAGH